MQSRSTATVRGGQRSLTSRLAVLKAQASWKVGNRTVEAYLRVQKKDVTARNGSAATKEASFTQHPTIQRPRTDGVREELAAGHQSSAGSGGVGRSSIKVEFGAGIRGDGDFPAETSMGWGVSGASVIPEQEGTIEQNSKRLCTVKSQGIRCQEYGLNGETERLRPNLVGWKERHFIREW